MKAFFHLLLTTFCVAGILLAQVHAAELPPVEKWAVFDLPLPAPAGEGNPFSGVQLTARFSQGERVAECDGFYDGGNTWRVRFMPDAEGEWRYETRSNRQELDGKSGAFRVGAPADGNRGPVRVAKTFHFSYADGTPYFCVGTTCYAWVHQPEGLQEQTLKTLAASPFNKLRMCIFPKSYTYNENEPALFPFVRGADGKFDFTRFDPAFWRSLEKRVSELRRLGIEADLVLFHPYDRWGFAEMTAEDDQRYVRYAVARLAAFRNVWWSLANEYDLMTPGALKGHRGDKKPEDWDRFFRIIRQRDPHGQLRGIHQWKTHYDHTRPWVTHASIQGGFDRVIEWREKYSKPVVIDECGYEGNIPQGWGNLSAEEMTRRFWIGTISGGYVGHGETYKHPEDILWWSKGGVLHGESPARIAYLRKTMEALPWQEMTPALVKAGVWSLSKPGEVTLVYSTKPEALTVKLSGGSAYKVEGIDTWKMTAEPLGEAQPGDFTFTPKSAGYLLRFTAARQPATAKAAAQ